MNTNFLPQYVVLAMCHDEKGDPGELSQERVARFDTRFFNEYGPAIADEARKVGITLDKRIASIVMLIAVMSKFQDPKRSVPIAVGVYLNARRNEVLDESRTPFAAAGTGVTAPVAAVRMRAAATAGVASRRHRSPARAGATRKK